MTIEQRTTRDGGPPIGHITRVTRTTTAIRPLLEGVQRLDASLDRLVKQAEDARRAEAEKQQKRAAERRTHIERMVDAAIKETSRQSRGRRSPYFVHGE